MRPKRHNLKERIVPVTMYKWFYIWSTNDTILDGCTCTTQDHWIGPDSLTQARGLTLMCDLDLKVHLFETKSKNYISENTWLWNGYIHICYNNVRETIYL